MLPQQEGALQPVIGLLSSKCTESQREAALLLGQFATTTDDYKAKIVQVWLFGDVCVCADYGFGCLLGIHSML